MLSNGSDLRQDSVRCVKKAVCYGSLFTDYCSNLVKCMHMLGSLDKTFRGLGFELLPKHVVPKKFKD